MPDEYEAISELWEEKPCPNCHNHTPIYEGMVCTVCGGFGFTMRLVSQERFINGELMEVWPDD